VRINLLSLQAVGLSSIVLFVAQREGLLAKHGVSVHLVPVGNGQVPELSEANPVGHIGAPAAIMRAARGADMKILASLDNGQLSNCLVVRPDIESAQDLRGRRLGARVVGAALWIHTVIALEQLGLDRERDDIDIASIGDPPQIVQALEDGRIDGAVLSRGQTREMVAKGFSVLLDLSPAHLYGAQDALVTTGGFLEKHSAAIEGLIAGLIEGAAYVQSDAGKTVTLETIKAELRITDNTAAEAGRIQLAQCLARKPYPSVERLRNMQRVMSTVELDVTAIDVACLIDDRFVASLDSRNFIDIVYRELKVF
jgi:ABC-type nitrate/sulfonate/bicarbonate transport system substrate-binding protein